MPIQRVWTGDSHLDELLGNLCVYPELDRVPWLASVSAEAPPLSNNYQRGKLHYGIVPEGTHMDNDNEWRLRRIFIKIQSKMKRIKALEGRLLCYNCMVYVYQWS